MKGIEEKMIIQKKLYSTQIHDLIKNKLLNGNLFPGDKINEAQLSAQLGVSRAPIREALCLLEREGIAVATQKGKYIRKLTAKEASDTYLTGAILEAKSVSSTCHLFTDKDLQELEDSFSSITPEMVQENEHLVIDEKFHTLLLKYEQNKVLVNLSRQLPRNLSKFLLICYWQKVSSAERFYDRHLELFNVVKTRNAALVEEAVMEHYRELGTKITQLMQDEEKK